MEISYVFLAEGFEEIEALSVVDVLRRAGMPVATVAIGTGTTAPGDGKVTADGDKVVTGAHGVPVVADIALAEADMAGAEWLILPGGMPGATNLKDCEPLCQALVERAAAGKNIAAICASPSVVFGQLGLLKQRNAVCYPGMEAIGMNGSWLSDDPVVTDGNIITANGPAAAPWFGLAIVAASLGADAARTVADGMLLTRQ